MYTTSNDYHYHTINDHEGKTYSLLNGGYIPGIEENYVYTVKTLETTTSHKGGDDYSFRGQDYTPYNKNTNSYSNRRVTVLNDSTKTRRRTTVPTSNSIIKSTSRYATRKSSRSNKECVCGNEICTCGARNNSISTIKVTGSHTKKEHVNRGGYKNSAEAIVINNRVNTKLTANKIHRHHVEGISNTVLKAISNRKKGKKVNLNKSVTNYSRRKNDDQCSCGIDHSAEKKYIKTIESKYISKVNKLPILYMNQSHNKRL